jgi:hypothetical protein
MLWKTERKGSAASGAPLGWAASTAVVASGGACRIDPVTEMTVCWGGSGPVTLLANRGGTTYGGTFYAAKGRDPRPRLGNQVYADLMEHEAVHRTQWSWGGPVLFPAAYGLAELGGMLAGKDPGCGNLFEIQADLTKGGYTCP